MDCICTCLHNIETCILKNTTIHIQQIHLWMFMYYVCIHIFIYSYLHIHTRKHAYMHAHICTRYLDTNAWHTDIWVHANVKEIPWWSFAEQTIWSFAVVCLNLLIDIHCIFIYERFSLVLDFHCKGCHASWAGAITETLFRSTSLNRRSPSLKQWACFLGEIVIGSQILKP